jgi:hypothetical protein
MSTTRRSEGEALTPDVAIELASNVKLDQPISVPLGWASARECP